MKQIILFFCIIAFKSVLGQSIRKDADLDFSLASDTGWRWFKGHSSIATIERSNLGKGKNSYLNITAKKAKSYNPKMAFTLYRNGIILPLLTANNQLKIEIESKGKDFQNEYTIAIVGLDNDNREIFLDTRIHRPSKSWNKDRFKNIPHTVRSVAIKIEYQGTNLKEQEFQIKPIHIRKDGKSIIDLPLDQLLDIKAENVALNIKDITPVSLLQNNIAAAIFPPFKDKFIVGLGESTHGSQSVVKSRITVLKQLILSGKCAVLAMECPLVQTFVMNSFIQGAIKLEQMDFVKDLALANLLTDTDELIEFLKWLRECNRSSKSIVSIVGLEPTYSLKADRKNWINFFYSVLGKTDAKPYIMAIQNENFNLLDTIKLGPTIFSKEANFIFSYIMKCYKMNGSGERNDKVNEIFKNRDIYMAKHVQFFYNKLLAPEQMMVLYAHSDHLRKTIFSNQEDLIGRPTLGSQLAEKYGDQYFNISFQFGSGAYCIPSLMADRVYSQTLGYLPKYSFEYVASQVPIQENFYIPSDKISKKLNSTLSIQTLARDYLFSFRNIQKDFDGYVFIQESVPINFKPIPIGEQFKRSDSLINRVWKILEKYKTLN
ncbi:erythromycin esterase family protein [Sphingobacterium sp.]|uniref:erythromycin esterase family protein n=1 Tax=Sphingobacterium sp. TaxID=341027 RepID=UPI002FDECF64